MADKRVYAVCFGGASSEHTISCVSAAWVAENIDKDKFEVLKIGITREGLWYLYKGSTAHIRDGSWEKDASALFPCVISPSAAQHGLLVLDKDRQSYTEIRVDAVFPALHGKNGEDGTIQGLFILAGIPFVGAGAYSSAVCINKHTAKLLTAFAGAAELADWICVKNTPEDTGRALSWAKSKACPLFVKPACAGSSIGITKVKEESALVPALKEAFRYDGAVLVEEAVVGKEIETAVLETKSGIKVSRCGEIDPAAEFYDYNAKYFNGTAKRYIPARIPEETAEKVRTAAGEIFRLLDCRGLARVDFFVRPDGRVVFNEINTMPGMTDISLYPLLAADMGYDGKRLTEELFESAVRDENA